MQNHSIYLLVVPLLLYFRPILCALALFALICKALKVLEKRERCQRLCGRSSKEWTGAATTVTIGWFLGD
jgi:hypothetical protein